MLYSRKYFSLLVSVLATAGMTSQAMAQTAPHIGLVDRDKVVTSYPRAQSAVEDIRKAEEHFHGLIETSNKQYEEAKAAKKPASDLENLQKRLQTSIDAEQKGLESRAKSLEGQLEKDINAAIEAEAKAKQVDLVLLKPAVLVGGIDITDGVMKRLASSGAGAPAKTTTK
jgi:Skp family chaperone for outer membrane proteins